jgi:hypothetical protein
MAYFVSFSFWFDQEGMNRIELTPKRDCVKTNFNFRKLLALCEKCWQQDAIYANRVQLFEHDLSFHTV